MTAKIEDTDGRGLWERLFHREPAVLEIDQHQAGDILSERPVFVGRDGALVGDVKAPRITVAGLVHGNLSTQVLAVHHSGQIWGDVAADSVKIVEGGKIHGWVSTVREEDGSISENGTGALAAAREQLPPELAQELAAAGTRPAGVLRKLQLEAGAALAARHELESRFEERIQEVAGDKIERARVLEEKLEQEHKTAAQLKQQVAATTRALQAHAAQVEQQGEELESLRQLLRQRRRALDELEMRRADTKVRLSTTLDEKEALETKLAQATARVEALGARVKKLESALQVGAQHRAEQKEKLLHWQRMAKENESRVAELEGELEAAQLALEEGKERYEALQQDMNHTEEALQKALEEIELLSQEQLNGARALAVAKGEQAETAMWMDACLQAEQAERKQAEMAGQTEAANVAFYARVADQWKEYVGRLADLLYEARQEKWTIEADYSLDVELRDEVTVLRQRIREREAQVEAYEAEVAQYRAETAEQGQRLAEARANLAELQATGSRQERTIEQVQAEADRRIQALQDELDKKRLQLRNVLTRTDVREKYAGRLRQEES